MPHHKSKDHEEAVRTDKRKAHELNKDLLGDNEVPDKLKRDPKLDEESRPDKLEKKSPKGKRHKRR